MQDLATSCPDYVETEKYLFSFAKIGSTRGFARNIGGFPEIKMAIMMMLTGGGCRSERHLPSVISVLRLRRSASRGCWAYGQTTRQTGIAFSEMEDVMPGKYIEFEHLLDGPDLLYQEDPACE